VIFPLLRNYTTLDVDVITHTPHVGFDWHGWYLRLYVAHGSKGAVLQQWSFSVSASVHAVLCEKGTETIGRRWHSLEPRDMPCRAVAYLGFSMAVMRLAAANL